MANKSESKALIEAYAKTSGKPAEEIAAEIAGIFGYSKSNIPIPTNGDGEEKLSPMMRAIIEARKTEQEMGAAGKGEVSPVIKMMMETVTMMPLMKMMGGMGQETTSQKPQQENIMELLAKNDEKWERRLEAMEAKQEKKQEKEALQRQLDEMKALMLSSSGSKKDELSEKFEKLNEKLDAEKEKRFDEALSNKGAEIDQLKEYMQTSLDDLRNQPTPKSSDEGFFEMMQKMEKFDSMVRSRGKALGMTDEAIEREIAKEKPMKQQILSDVFKTINRGIDAYAGRKPEPISEDQPEIATQILCGNCGKASTNGTDWCDACRIQYSNDVLAEQQKKQAAQATLTQQTEAEARAKGEIPVEAQQQEETPQT